MNLCGITFFKNPADNGGSRGVWAISVPPSQFCCKPKTALKNYIFLKIFMALYLGKSGYLVQVSKVIAVIVTVTTFPHLFLR